MPIPPLDEQAAIVRFLSWANGRLERAIRVKRKLIAALNEYKQALINVAMAVKPNEAAERKRTRLKYCTSRLEQGWSPQCDAQPAAANEWGVLKVGCVNREEFNPNENKKLPESLHPLSELEIQDGDIMVSRANTRELLGLAALAKNPRSRLLLCDKLFRFRAKPNVADPQFLVFALRSNLGRLQIESSTNGASDSMQNIGQDVIRNLAIFLPSLEEQQRIVTEILQSTGKLRDAIARAERQVVLEREHYARLVADVVTGKRDVRKVAAALPDEPMEVEPTEMVDLAMEEASDLDSELESVEASE